MTPNSSMTARPIAKCPNTACTRGSNEFRKRNASSSSSERMPDCSSPARSTNHCRSRRAGPGPHSAKYSARNTANVATVTIVKASHSCVSEKGEIRNTGNQPAHGRHAYRFIDMFGADNGKQERPSVRHHALFSADAVLSGNTRLFVVISGAQHKSFQECVQNTYCNTIRQLKAARAAPIAFGPSKESARLKNRAYSCNGCKENSKPSI